MIIGIDIDDTITKTSEIAAYNLSLFDNSYTDYHNLPKDRYEEFMRKYQAVGLKNAKMKDGVKEAFDYLNNNGFKIIIVTARDTKYSSEIKNITLDYLKDHGLKYDKIIFGQSSKGECAKKEGVNIFIDDKETILDDVAKYNIETIKISNIKSDKHKTFSKWSDIIDYIKSKWGNKNGWKNYYNWRIR